MSLNTFLLEFKISLLVAFGIIVYLVLWYFHATTPALLVGIASIVYGSHELLVDTYHSLLKKQFALDYIAILAIIVSLITQQYLVGMILALMIASGRNLENYGVNSAKRSLTKLIDRIPREVLLWRNDATAERVQIEKVQKGQQIFIRKGEVIPLDGLLLSKAAAIDESSLTGEPYPVDKIEGDSLISGTINVGQPLVLKTSKEAKDSTYRKIIALVEKAEGEKAPLVRLADKYSTIFTIITFVLATVAYVLHPGLESILAVLVVATPCPLILATPIALLGGVNAAAKRRIIVKQLASLETLARVTTIIFDKTGTITIGKPTVTDFKLITKAASPTTLLSIAESIERQSLHPLAKAIVNYSASQKVPTSHAKNVKEVIGTGISGEVDGKVYTLSKLENKESGGMAIGILHNNKLLATFTFADEIKQDSKDIVTELRNRGIGLSLFTGDKEQAAEKVVKALGGDISVKAECTPEDKQKGIEALKKKGYITAMVGDGINDAPALALADVGMVFSNEEQTAASEAADIVFLGGTFKAVESALFIAQRTIRIAMQSILWGIGLSILAMIFAAFGLIPPLFGAGIQEAIDVAVILNALRTAE